jgi:anti-anti-sigma factor
VIKESMRLDCGIEIVSENSVSVLSFTESSITDSEKISEMAKQIAKFLSDENPDYFIFDFEGVRFFSSQMLGLLLQARDIIIHLGGTILVSSIDPQLYRVFKITNLNTIFTFYPDKESAIRSVKIS